MNGNLKTGLSVLAGIIVGAVGAVLNGGSKAASRVKGLRERVRGKRDEPVV